MLRNLLAVVAICLIVMAVTTIDTQQIDWMPGWPMRLTLCGAGVALAIVALLAGRWARKP